MARIRITKEFRFEAAHALHNYDGLCRNIHGHSYILKVTVIGETITDSNSPKLGMVMDFGDLKDIVKQSICKSVNCRSVKPLGIDPRCSDECIIGSVYQSISIQ
jgi:6-pyruvoyltetrahydropterin/6-carboxytetrahydropterin synthase